MMCHRNKNALVKSLQVLTKGSVDVFDKGCNGSEETAVGETMGVIHMKGWRCSERKTRWVLQLPLLQLVLQWWECRQQRQLSKRHRRRWKTIGERRRNEEMMEGRGWRSGKLWGWGKSVRLEGKRGTAGGMNIRIKQLAGKEEGMRCVTQVEVTELESGWQKTEVDRMMGSEKQRGFDGETEGGKKRQQQESEAMMMKREEANRLI